MTDPICFEVLLFQCLSVDVRTLIRVHNNTLLANSKKSINEIIDTATRIQRVQCLTLKKYVATRAR